MKIKMETPFMTLWKMEGEESTPPHVHEREFQITVPVYGTCRFVSDNRAYELTCGEGFVEYPDEPHELHLTGGTGVIVLQVDRGRFANFSRLPSLELEHRQQIDPARLGAEFRKWATALLRYPDEPMAVEETEAEVLRFLSLTLKGNQTRDRSAASVGALAADPHMAQALDYLHAHFTEKLSIEALAAIALQSRFHFIRSFQGAVGVTPYQYMLSLRIEEAKARLAQSRATVTEISFSLGFSSTSQFYRTFVKRMGVTPEQYRSGLLR